MLLDLVTVGLAVGDGEVRQPHATVLWESLFETGLHQDVGDDPGEGSLRNEITCRETGQAVQ